MPKKQSKPKPKPKKGGHKSPQMVGVAERVHVGSSNKFTRSQVFRGQVVLGTVATATYNNDGTILLDRYLGPNMVAPSEMGVLASAYDKYRFRSARLVFKPACPTSTPGQLAMVLSSNPLEDLPLTGQFDNIAASHPGFKAFSTFVSASADMKLAKGGDKKWMTQQVGSVDAWAQGRVYVACFTGCPANTVFGKLFMEYDIEFFNPSLSNTAPPTVAVAASSVNFAANASSPVNQYNIPFFTFLKSRASIGQLETQLTKETLSDSDFQLNGTEFDLIVPPGTWLHRMIQTVTNDSTATDFISDLEIRAIDGTPMGSAGLADYVDEQVLPYINTHLHHDMVTLVTRSAVPLVLSTLATGLTNFNFYPIMQYFRVPTGAGLIDSVPKFQSHPDPARAWRVAKAGALGFNLASPAKSSPAVQISHPAGQTFTREAPEELTPSGSTPLVEYSVCHHCSARTGIAGSSTVKFCPECGWRQDN